MQMTVRDLMSQRPTVVYEHATIRETLSLLLQDHVAEVYVTDELGNLLGNVPNYELFKARLGLISDSERVVKLMSQNGKDSPNPSLAGLRGQN